MPAAAGGWRASRRRKIQQFCRLNTRQIDETTTVRWCAPCWWRGCRTGPSSAEGSAPQTGSSFPAAGHPHQVRRRPSRLTMVRRRSVPSSLGASADPVGAIGPDGHQRGASPGTYVMPTRTVLPTHSDRRDPMRRTAITPTSPWLSASNYGRYQACITRCRPRSRHRRRRRFLRTCPSNSQPL